MSVLARYVSGQILLRLLIILFAILAFEISFDLLERADRILAAHDGDYRAVFRYAALRVPGLLVDLLPAATLLAALLVMGNLLRHRELVASWNMGLSPAWLMGKLLPLAAILGLVQAVVGEVALPPSAKALAAMGFGDRREGVLTANAEGPLWIRQGQDVVRIVPAGSGNARSVSIFRLDQEGLLLERLDARRVRATPEGWVLHDVVRRPVGATAVEHLERLAYSDTLDFGYLALLAADARDLPLRSLIRILAAGETGSRPYGLFVTWAIYRVVSVLAPLLMIMLAVALAQRHDRTGGMARTLVTGGGIGFAYFCLDRAAVALGEVGMIPPWFAATGASIALTGAIAWLVLRHRGRLRPRWSALAT